MKIFSLRGALTVSLLLVGQSSFASLTADQIKQCISNEMDVVRVIHPLKAEYLRLEREGSVAELMDILRSNSEELSTMTDAELLGSEANALATEVAEVNSVLESSNSCVDARKAALGFIAMYDKKPLLSLDVFFDSGSGLASEAAEWKSEALHSLRAAGYTKAASTLTVTAQPALTLLAVSGETTSVLNEQFILPYDETMKSAFKAIVGEDASAKVLESRLSEKIRKEALTRMTRILNSVDKLVSR
ncbi:hypothetical protein [Bdellovibrio sp. HCB274]|uniref:hypothetical protein n=1 Tax=Bdellovibrio sp. HCB274 TaxID=3394361 RepID=UPI0039B55508